jgi:hypothetical protein
MREAGILIGCPWLARHSIRGEGIMHECTDLTSSPLRSRFPDTMVIPVHIAADPLDSNASLERDANVGIGSAGQAASLRNT